MVPVSIKRGFYRLWWVLPALSLILSVAISAKIVADTRNAPIEKILLADCSAPDDDAFQCWKQKFESLVYSESAEKALDQAKSENDKGGYVRANCHQLAHVIGRAAAKKYELKVAETFEHGNQFCASGYYHGAMESVVAEVGPQKIKDTINEICKPFRVKNAYNLKHYDCVHGLGHGVMSMENYELYRALEDCELLSDTWERDSCSSGVFMENIMSVFNNPDYQTKYLDKNRPLYPCTDVDDIHKTACYLNQSSYALTVTNFNYATVFELCGEAGSSDIICYQSLGRDASGNSIQDPASANQICQLGKSYERVANCVIGAVKDIIWIGNSKEKGEQFCALQQSVEIKRTCFDTAESYYASF